VPTIEVAQLTTSAVLALWNRASHGIDVCHLHAEPGLKQGHQGSKARIASVTYARSSRVRSLKNAVANVLGDWAVAKGTTK
jgi:hypothetical protein